MKNIFWLAGEKSGDLHAAEVMRVLNRQGEYCHCGIGGEKMQAAGLQSEFDFSRFNVMGFIEVVQHLRFFSQVEKRVKTILSENPPDLLVLVDYPGLNMRLAEFAKKRGIKVLYYICPQFWAWKKKRIFKLQKFTDHICYILPFEGEHFARLNIPATYVGHPIAEEITLRQSKEEFAQKYHLDIDKPWIGFFPGSRNAEITRILPEYVEAIKHFPQAEFQFLISQANSVDADLFQQHLGQLSAEVHLIPADNYEMMHYCDMLSVTSGTATLESAYAETPFVIVYKTAPISYAIGKHLVKISRIGLPNIILDEDLLPELIQEAATGKNIARELLNIWQDKKLFDLIKLKLKKIHQILGKKSASETCAEKICELLGD
jgi:lipid-A-disaccharide synthase